MDSLSKWNYVASAVHFVATIATISLLKDDEKPTRLVQMTRNKFDETASPSQSKVDIPIVLENNVSIDLKFILVLFFGITSAAHFLYATDFLGKGWYSRQVNGYGWNPYRWIEYSITAGLMIYLISATSGTKDQVSAVSAALITPGLMINGFTTERSLHQNAIHNWSINPKKFSKPQVDVEIVFSNLLPAWFLFGVHWYIILANYGKIVKEAKDSGKPLDPTVTFMVYSQLIFFSLFGSIQTFQVYRWYTSQTGREEPSFASYEKAYIALSAITKLLLGATVYYSLKK